MNLKPLLILVTSFSCNFASSINEVNFTKSKFISNIKHSINLDVNIKQNVSFLGASSSDSARILVVDVISSCQDKTKGYSETQKIIAPTAPKDKLNFKVTNVLLCKHFEKTDIEVKVFDPKFGLSIKSEPQVHTNGKLVKQTK